MRYRILSFALALTGIAGCGDSSPDGAAAGAPCDTSEAEAALSGTCAAGLSTLLECWSPEGNCVANIELSGDFDVVFDNGAVIETQIDGTSATGRYVNAGGTQCGTYSVPSGSTQVNVRTTGGEEFAIGANGEVRCPNGGTVPLDDIQQQAVRSCTAAGQSTCETPDIGDLPDIPMVDDLMCTSDDQCPRIGGEQWRCCLSIPTTGQRFCSSPQACAFL